MRSDMPASSRHPKPGDLPSSVTVEHLTRTTRTGCGSYELLPSPLQVIQYGLEGQALASVSTCWCTAGSSAYGGSASGRKRLLPVHFDHSSNALKIGGAGVLAGVL